MAGLHEIFPAYDFLGHKGYVTPVHNAALDEHGPCAEHRFSYVNVAAVSGRGNRPPRARRPAVLRAPAAEPLMLWPVPEGTVGVASGDQPQPSPSVGEDEAMEGEKR